MHTTVHLIHKYQTRGVAGEATGSSSCSVDLRELHDWLAVQSYCCFSKLKLLNGKHLAEAYKAF